MRTQNHLSPIRPVAAYELVAQQIQRAVHMGLLLPGDRLPPERVLAKQLGVARMTVREAIRVLAHENLVTVRRGVQGGMWIRAQDVSKREIIRLAADTDRAIGDVYEFRETVECASARLAAKRAKPKDIRKLRHFSRAMKKLLASHLVHPAAPDVPAFLALDSQFHTYIAKVSGNTFICEAVERAIAARYAPFGAVFRVLTADANNDHEEITAAIAAGDGARAARIMSAHVQRAHEGLVSILNRHVRAETAR